MSEDRVIANTLERATSTDFNAAQATQARKQTDWIMADHAEHVAPIEFWNGGTPVITHDTKRAVISGLNVYAGSSANEIYVGPGTLSQWSPPGSPFTGPAWTGARDPATEVQTGVLRGTATVPYVSTAGLGLNIDAPDAYHLLCVRLAEVIVLSTTVDIFDVPTQAFVPTALAKRVELRVEFQWILGGALNVSQTILPSLDAGGAEWEPLAYVAFVYPGGVNSASGANQGKVIDVARRVEGLTGGWIRSGGSQTQGHNASIASQLSARLTSALSPDSGNAAGGALAGSAFADINGEKAILSISQAHRQFSDVDATDGSTPGDWDLVHYYLCPLESATRRRWPLKTLLNSFWDADRSHVARGLIVGSTIQPTRDRKNSAPITLYYGGARAQWTNMSAVPAGAAQYICSGHSLLTGAFDRIYPMVRSAGGSVMYPLGEQNNISGDVQVRWRCPAVGSFPAESFTSQAIVRSQDIDLRDIVPRTATAVHLLFEMLDGSNFDAFTVDVRNRVDQPANAITPYRVSGATTTGQRLAAGTMVIGNPITHEFDHPMCILRVPTGWAPALNHIDANQTPIDGYHYWLTAVISSWSAGTFFGEIQIRVVGWDE